LLNEKLVSGSWDATVKLWDLQTNACVKTYKGHTGDVQSVGFDGHRIVSGGKDKTIKVWSTTSNFETLTVKAHTATIKSLCLRGSVIASGSEDTHVKIWDLGSGSLITDLTGHSKGVWCVCMDMEGRTVFSGGDDAVIKCWDLRTKKCVNTFGECPSFITSIHIENGKLLCSTGTVIQIRDLTKNGAILQKLVGHKGSVMCTAVNDFRIVSGSYDNAVRIWNIRDGTDYLIREHAKPPRSIHSDASRIVTGSHDAIIRLFDFSGVEIKQAKGEKCSVS